MPRKKRSIFNEYNLNKEFTSAAGYKYFSGADPTEHLQLWLRPPKGDPGPITAMNNEGSASPTFSYAGTITTTDLTPFDKDKVGNLTPSVYFSGGGSPSTITANTLTALGDGVSTDTPFSVHAWIKGSIGTAGASVATLSDTGGAGAEVRIGVLPASVGTLQFNIASTTGNSIGASTSTAALLETSWTHLVLTYAGTKTYSGLKIYINGDAVSTSDIKVGSYTVCSGLDYSLQTGGANYLLNSNSGLYELGFYHNKVLSAEDVAALYDVHVNGLASNSIKVSEYRESSGITSLATRPYLNFVDNMTGSYPATLRNSRDGSFGNYRSQFDDTTTIIFASASNPGVPAAVLAREVILGQQIPVGSQYSGSLVVTPNINPTLTLANTKTSVIPGISDERVTFTPGVDFRPFKEADLYAASRIGISDPFWTTGSLPEEVGPGFIQPLWSKSSFEIDLDPIGTSDIFFGTGTLPATEPALNVGSGISYYNFDDRKFHMIGNLTTGSAIDYMANRFDRVTGSMLAFAPVHGLGAYVYDDPPTVPQTLASSQYEKDGCVTSVAGFPFSAKFNATSSQLFSVDSVITSPFLVEKIVYEFSASFPQFPAMGAWLSRYDNLYYRTPPVVHNFFILNQRPFSFNSPAHIKSFGLAREPEDLTYQNRFGVFPCTGSQRDIVYVGQVSTLQDPPLTEAGVPGATALQDIGFWTGSLYKRDLDIFEDFTTTQGITSSFILSGAANSPVASEFAFSILPPFSRPGAIAAGYMNMNCPGGGGRSGLAGAHRGSQLVSPRSLVRGASGGEAVPILPLATSLGVNAAAASRSKKSYDVSPYILMPGDKLIFGWANQPTPVPMEEIAGAEYDDPERDYFDHPLKILPGAGKIRIYGSLLKEGKEFHQGLNQMLTSDAIHEDVSSNLNPYGQADVLDQEHRSYYQEFTGSYIDRVLPDFNPRSSDHTSRVGTLSTSVIGGQASTTGSLLRGVRIVDAHERYLDSTWPNPSVIASTNGTGFRFDANAVLAIDFDSGIAFYPMGDLNSGYAENPDVTWPRAYPFEEKYGYPNEERYTHIPTIRIRKDMVNADLREGQQKDAGIFIPLTPPQERGEEGTVPYMIAQYNAGLLEIGPARHQNREFLKMFFGFGDAATFNLGKVKRPHVKTGHGATAFVGKSAEIRGFKYGLINTDAQYSSCIYRYDRFGQLRDMLEQRSDTAFQEFRIPLAPATRRGPIYGPAGGGTPVIEQLVDPRHEQTVLGLGQKEAAVNARYASIVNNAGTVSLQAFTDYERDQVRANSKNVDVRGVWNFKCNIDDYARATTPFYDADRIIPSGSLAGTEVALTADLAELAAGSGFPAFP